MTKKKVEYSSNPEKCRQSIEEQALCFFKIEGFSEDPENPDCDAVVRQFVENVFGTSFEKYTYESFPLKCGSDTNGENVVEDTAQDLIAHCDGILMEKAPKWVCIFKSSQKNMTGDDVALLSSEDLIRELGVLGVTPKELLEVRFPYNFPKYHKNYREDLEPRWIPFLTKDGEKYLVCYAPDVLLKHLLNDKQLLLLGKIEEVILRLQKKNAFELPVGCGYVVSNERYLHGRNALSVLDDVVSGKRSVFRIRLYE